MTKQSSIVFFFCILTFIYLSGKCFGNPGFTNPDQDKPVQEIKNKQTAEAVLEQAKKIENNDPGMSNTMAQKVLTYATNENLSLLIVQAQLQVANILVIRTKYMDAMKIAIQARELSEKMEYNKEVAVYFEISGKIKSYTGDFDQSLEDLFKALKHFDKLKDVNGRCRVLNAIGKVYYWLREYDKALKYFNQAYYISIQIRDAILQAKSVNNLGLIFMVRKEYKQALLHYSEALAINQKTGQVLQAGGNYLNFGIIYMHLEKFKESFENYQRALAIFRQLENYSNLTLCYLDLGYYYEAAGDPVKSSSTFHETFQMAKKYGLKGIQLEVVTKLHDLYRTANMTDSAYKYAIIKANIKDSVEIEKSNTRLSIAELQYQYESKINEQKLKHQRLSFLTFATILTSIALVLISILIISRQRQKNKAYTLERKSFKDEIEFKNRELALSVMNLLKRNESIIDTSKRLLEIKPDLENKMMREEIFKIAKSLKDEAHKETWEEFDLRFKQVHSGFYENLLDQFPNLTSNELKLCGLLRLNLTTKEISDLTGQRRETVEMARFRLRKHMDLKDSQVTLVTFLAKI